MMRRVLDFSEINAVALPALPALCAMVEAFAPLRDHLPRAEKKKPPADDEYDGLSSTFAKLCREADEQQRRKLPDPRHERLRRLMDDDVSIERAWHKINSNGRAAVSTVEALMFSLRDDIHALTTPATLERLSQLDERQLSEVAERVQNFRQAIASVWTPDEVKALVRIWGQSHE